MNVQMRVNILRTFVTHLLDHMGTNSLLSNPESSCIVLVGDFNIPSISWSDNDSTPISSGGCANSEVLCELIGDNFL
jgi:hypothetical protein